MYLCLSMGTCACWSQQCFGEHAASMTSMVHDGRSIHWILANESLLQEDRTMYQALECCVQDAIGPGSSWAAAMDSGLVNNLGEPAMGMLGGALVVGRDR